MDLTRLCDRELLDLHCSLMDALRARGVIRSANNPVADYTETLVARALDATLQTNSKAGYDAVDQDGCRYQIKGRRLTASNGSTQLGAIRNLDGAPFDFLAAVVYDHALVVQYAALIPLSVVQSIGRYRSHTNAHTLHLRRSLLERSDVQDISLKVRQAAGR